jgi:dUTP pyrophosphatase
MYDRNVVIPYLTTNGSFPPNYANAGDAGCDLKSDEDLVLAAGEIRLVKTGLKISIPSGVVGMVCPRSGLAMKHGVTVLNAPGIVDSGYRGDVGVILINAGTEDFEIKAGDRIAQLVFVPYLVASWYPVVELNESERGSGGFGSTGVAGPVGASAVDFVVDANGPSQEDTLF